MLRFNEKDFAWRNDLDKSVLIYKYGGSQIVQLRGAARDQFLDVVVGESQDPDGINELLNLGILVAAEDCN